MLVDDLFESAYSGNTERAIARNMVQPTEVEEGDVAKLAGITALGIGAGLGANYLDQQAPRVEFDGKNGPIRAYLEPAYSNRIPDNAMVIKGKDGKTYQVWTSSGKGMNSKSYHAAPVEQVKEGTETAADIDKKIEFHKQGQAAAQYKGSMNKMHAKKIKDLEAKKAALKQGVAEGSGNVGAKIKALYQNIYNAGDDEIEYFYNDSPIFAQYWDEYEGDLDSIIAEVDPSELQVILDELESYAQQAGLTEGEVYDLEKEYGYEKEKNPPKRPSVPPIRPSHHPEDTDFMDPVERRLRADRERVRAGWAAHNAKKGVAESLSAMIANATSRDDLRQIRNFVTENVSDKNKQRQIMEQATQIVAVQRRKHTAAAVK